jgi:hypothetical protein
MAKTVPVKIHEINRALWGVEDWIRAVREVLAFLPDDQTIQVPSELMIYAEEGPGGIPYIRGCPPPPAPNDGCDDDDPGHGHGHGHAYGHDKDKDKGKGKTKKDKKAKGKTK